MLEINSSSANYLNLHQVVLFHEEVVVSGGENIVNMFFFENESFSGGICNHSFVPVECVRVCFGSSFLQPGKILGLIIHNNGTSMT